jgi:hypothetical protein
MEKQGLLTRSDWMRAQVPISIFQKLLYSPALVLPAHEE